MPLLHQLDNGTHPELHRHLGVKRICTVMYSHFSGALDLTSSLILGFIWYSSDKGQDFGLVDWHDTIAIGLSSSIVKLVESINQERPTKRVCGRSFNY